MSAVKIKIESLYKIFGKNPKEGMEHVKNGVDKDSILILTALISFFLHDAFVFFFQNAEKFYQK